MADTDNVLYAFLALILGGMILFAVYKTSSNSSNEKFKKQTKIRENAAAINAQTEQARVQREITRLASQIADLNRRREETIAETDSQLSQLSSRNAELQAELERVDGENFAMKKSASKNLENFKRQTSHMKETFKSTLAKCPGGNFENFSNKTTNIGKMKKEAFKKGKIPLRENYAGDNLGINTGANQLTSAELASNVARGGRVKITSTPQLGMELPSNARQPFRRRAGGRRMRR